MNDRADNIRMIKTLAAVPKERKIYRIPPFSKKKLDQMARDLENNSDAGQDKWFDYHMGINEPMCCNCGATADWLLLPKYFILWRACQAHILPKRRSQFPSLATNTNNHIVLFPSWGGWLCGCHDQYDSSWTQASSMIIWPGVVDVVKTLLYPVMPEREKSRLPELLLNQITHDTP